MSSYGGGFFGGGVFGGSGPPVMVSPPSITGTATVSFTLTGSPGTWDQSVAFAYQWRRTVSSVTTDISGATGTTYTLTGLDLGATITLHVVATSVGGSTPADSASVGPIVDYVAPAASPTSPSRPWTFVVTDIAGVAIGEPLAEGRSYSAKISGTETASFQVRVGSKLWEQIAAGDSMLKVYNSSDQLVFWGDVITDELSADGQVKTVKITAADLSFRLARRFVGRTGTGVTYTNTDPAQIIYTELGKANADFPTGIVSGVSDSFYPRTTTLTFRRLSEVLAELGAISSSYEWTLRYVDGAPPAVYLDLESMVGEDVSSDVFFEYGTGRNNCQGYRRVRSIEQLATRVYAQAGGSTNTVVAFDSGTDGLVRRFEDVISVSDISDVGMLDSLAAAHVAFRHQPRMTVTVTPSPAFPSRYGVDWWKGDVVTLRSVIGGVADTNGAARVWSADIMIDELGNENATPILEPS